MYRIASPFTDATYAAIGDGYVELECDGRRGTFDGDGRWVAGELRTADPQMCRWVSTATGTPNRHAQSVAARRTETGETPA